MKVFSRMRLVDFANLLLEYYFFFFKKKKKAIFIAITTKNDFHLKFIIGKFFAAESYKKGFLVHTYVMYLPFVNFDESKKPPAQS